MVNIMQGSSGPVVILVDDDNDYLETAAELIRPSGYAIFTASNIKEAMELAHKLTGPAVLFTDFNMRSAYSGIHNGLELIEYVNENTRFPVQCALVTGQKDHTLFVKALALGARYFTKEPTAESDMNLGELYVAEIKAAYNVLKQRIKDMGQKMDPLTGVLDRSSAQERWFQEWNRMARHRTSTACVFMDVNDLKKINDTYGHKAGDMMLTFIAKAIKHHIRTLDFVYRHGGDEFVAILPETTEDEAMAIVDRLTEYLKLNPVNVGDGEMKTFTVSCGVAVFRAEDLTPPLPEEKNDEDKLRTLALQDFEDLIHKADELMYVAKKEYKALVWQILWKHFRTWWAKHFKTAYTT